MSPADVGPPSTTARIVLLAAQGFALGLTLAWVTIPASAIFLTAYGADLLPVTYIGAAVAGVVASSSLAVALRRRPVAAIATWVLVGVALALVVARVLLAGTGAEWVSFALLVLVPIIVPIGFLFVVGQAGLLLDVRALKALYARVVAGFALGVVSGGLAGPLLLEVLGGTEDLLAAAAMAAALLLSLVVVARRRYPSELSAIEHDEHGSERVSIRSLSRSRYVRLIVAFQMLSAVESQWLDFLVFDRAADRYDDSTELARFVSQFAAIAYGLDIAFLLLLAGLLLRRFGLRYGLTANSLGVLTMLAGIVVATLVQGSGATIVFALVVGARVVDLTFSDGTSRTSLSAAYQAVPSRLRALAQATVEGLAVPVAIGHSGIVLLLVESAGLTEGLLLPVLTGLVVTAWLFAAVLLYRDYGPNLLASLRGRTFDHSTLTVDDESSLLVIDRLVESADERDVRLGLDILTVAQHPGLHARLEQLALDGRVNVRTDALERLREVAPRLAADAARVGLADRSPSVRAASVRVLGAVGSGEDVGAVTARFDDPSDDVRLAVAFALTRMEGDAGRRIITEEIQQRATSEEAHDRALAASMLRECDPEAGISRSILRSLLADPVEEVVCAALAAVRLPWDGDVLPAAAEHIHDPRTAEAAVEMLVRAGDAALDVVDDGLRSTGLDRRVHELLVRAARDVGGEDAVEVLRDHIVHPDPDVGLVVIRALAALAPIRSGDHPDPRELAIVPRELEHATHVLRALIAVADETAADVLCGALRDELDLLSRRVIAALSIRHGTTDMSRVALQLAQPDARSHALAIEWLDVTLTGTERPVVALLEPGLTATDRLLRIRGALEIERLDRSAVLRELVEDDDRRWRPWIKACAVHVAAVIAPGQVDALATAAKASTTTRTQEASVLHDTIAGLRARQLDLV